jgi:hypothetical protein
MILNSIDICQWNLTPRRLLTLIIGNSCANDKSERYLDFECKVWKELTVPVID